MSARHRHDIALLLSLALILPGWAEAAEPQRAPGLLPTEVARPLLENDPAVLAARAGLDVAKAEARGLNASPYEWTARASGQRRNVRDESSYGEWNAGIERTIRLPAKATADRELGKSEVAASEAAYGEALHEAARDLSALWVDWLAAERAQALATGSLQSFEESVAAVEKRKRAGDAAKLDLGTARAELVEQRRLENDAKTAATVAWTRLSMRFPGLLRQPAALPLPLPVEADASAWRDRILSQSDELRIAEVSALTAQAQAARARADRIPDPTLGAYTASEIDGREKIVGISVSIPIPLPGGARNARSAKAVANAEVSQYEAQVRKQTFATEIASAFVSARGAYESLKIAAEGAAAMQDNAGLIQRAYTLGEAGLQDLLIARRQAASAANSALQAQATALKAYYGLVVDAHWVWDLEHE
jgi:outer membrane protein, heavy metal efflux system